MDEQVSERSLQQKYHKETFSDALALFQALADNAPALIWMAGPDKKFSFFNKRWLQFTGRNLEKEKGDGWLVGIHQEDVGLWTEAYTKNFNARDEFSVKYRLRRHDGEYRWLLDNGSPFYLPSGEFAGYIGSCVDVTESMSEISELENQNYLIKTITDNATVGLFLLDKDYNCTFMNPAAENITGYTRAEIQGRTLHDVIHHSHPDGTPFPIEDCPLERSFTEMKIVKDLEQVYIRKNGEFFDSVCSASPLINGGELVGAVIEVRDISEEKRSQKIIKSNEARFRALIEKSSDVISLIDVQGNNHYTSPSIQRVLGYTPAEFGERNGFGYVHPDDMAFVQEEFAKLLENPGGGAISEMRVQHSDGSWRWIETVSTNLLEDPNIKAIVVNFRDVTERKMAEEKAQYQYYHDSLTDLPNRNYFTERLAGLLQNAEGKIFGVMIIDLDRFKMINESLGHAIGDRLIQEVSLRLVNSLDEDDILARLGGDEYGIILPEITREEEIGQTCSRILECLKPGFRFEQHELYITPSIGISVYPYDGQDASSLMKNADSALYRAKEMGRNNFQYYTPSMNATTFHQLAMENTLRKALENNEFLVYYIPQIDVATGKIIQVEALIRWMHPELGLTFPDEFIPIAETTGLIVPIGEWVLRRACEDVKSWEKNGFHMDLSVNLSARQLRQRHLTRNIRRIVEETGFDPNRLEFELTESTLVDNSHALYNTMIQLQRDGIRFAIDDFSTGHSSLDYIKKFPVHSLKVSHAFMKGIPLKEKDTAIANAVINLSRSLGLLVTAEGVERLDQFKFLKERNCDKAQGYLFSPPIPSQEMLQLLERGNSWEI
jgi:diguanylate cyclase (GGDEF)-like protein/PAS domain S-box-containing protein